MAIESMKTTTLFHHEEETMKRNKRKTPVPKEKHTTFFQGPHLVLGSFWLNLYPNGDTKSTVTPTTSTPTSATTTTYNNNNNTLGSASHKSRVYQRRSKRTQKQGVNQRAYTTRKSLESEREKEKTEHDVAETLAELKQILSSSEASDDEYTEPNSSFYQTVPTHPSSSTTAINALTTTATSNVSGHHHHGHHHHHHGNSIVNLARNHDGLSENVTSSANFFSQNGTLLSMTDMDLDTDASFLSEIDHEQENEFDRDADDEQSSHDNHAIKQDSLVPFILVKPKNKIGRPRSSIHQSSSSSSHNNTMVSPSFSSPSSQVEKKIAKVKTSSSSTSSSSGKSKGGARVSSHKNQPIQKSGGPCFFCSTTVSTYWRNKYSHKVCNPCGIRLTKYNVWCPGCRYVPNKEECKGTCGTCGKKYVSF